MARIPINGQAYEGTSIDVNYQRTVNWYPESDPTGKDSVPLYPTPGLINFTTAGSGPVRASIVLSTLMYVVSSDGFYSITTAGSVTNIGSITTTSGRVEMAHNGDEIIIVDGTQAAHYKLSTDTFTADITTIADDGIGGGAGTGSFPTAATTISFLDTYFTVNDPDNTNTADVPGAFFISGVYNGQQWAALDFDVAERSWDQIEAIRTANGQLWLVGEDSSEVWWHSGNDDFPFERIPSAVIEYGTSAGHTVAEADNTLVFLSSSARGAGQILQTQGHGTPRKISHDGLDDKLHGYTLSDAFSFVYQWKGHTFCVFTFPTSNKTWIYDLSTGLWFQWSTDDDDSRHISNTYIYFNDKHYVGSRVDGSIYQLSDVAYDDDGTAITRLRQSPHLHFQGKVGWIRALELILEQGVANGSVPDPQVMLQWSKDRGHTWNSEQWRDVLGSTGEYSKASTWRRIGRTEDIIWRIKITDAVKAVLIGAYMDVPGVGDLDVT